MDLKVGVFMFLTAETIGVVELARAVERLGFESLFLPEHAVIPADFVGPYPGGGDLPDEYRRMLDPFVALAAAAGVTERIRLGTAISLVPERHPLITAQTVASLDHHSGGRFVFGVGSGWLQAEGEIMGVDWARRGAQMADYLQAMRRCWSGEPVRYQGAFVRFDEIQVLPRPVQRPHPPILIGGELKQVAQRAARWGNGWMPRALFTDVEAVAAGRRLLEKCFHEHGRSAAEIDITLFGGRADRDAHRRWHEVGVTRVLKVLPAEPRARTLARLERIAEKLAGS